MAAEAKGSPFAAYIRAAIIYNIFVSFDRYPQDLPWEIRHDQLNEPFS